MVWRRDSEWRNEREGMTGKGGRGRGGTDGIRKEKNKQGMTEKRYGKEG